MSDCLFCKIIAGTIPATKLAESSGAIAIADIQPQAPVHALIIPKTHVVGLSDMTTESRRVILPELYELAAKIAHEKGLYDSGYRTVINNGRDGGQTVFHLHLHVLGGTLLGHRFGS